MKNSKELFESTLLESKKRGTGDFFVIQIFEKIVFQYLEMLGELFKNTPVQLSFWDKILLIKSKRAHALSHKI